MKKLSVLVALLLALGSLPAGASPIPPRAELWVMDADGTGQRRVGAEEPMVGGAPDAWSPDSTQIVVDGLHVVDVATGATRRLTDGNDRFPDWSTVRDEIVFARPSSEPTGSDERIYTIRPDGTGERLVVDMPGRAWDPTWSPDGTRIAFIALVPDQGPRLFVVNADGSDPRQLSDRGAHTPQWSPDGGELAIHTPDLAIYLVKADGSGERRLVPGEGTSTYPSWCPDGSLAFTRWTETDQDGPNGIWLAEDPGLRFITSGAYPDCGPGNKIAFSRGDDIHVVDPSEAGTPNLTDSPDRNDWYPLWSPDGSKIAFSSTPQPPPPIPVERTVTASLRRHLIARGNVTASNESCLPRGPEVWPLSVQRLTESGWKTVRQVAVDGSGDFRVRLRDRPGFYRVLAPQADSMWGTYLCEEAVSKLMEHRH